MFVTSSQNFEDVMLWRALNHVKQGFYIDVGAFDPDIHSVTRAFYDQGWKGINIEPIKDYWDKLCINRPRDINLNLAIGSKKGKRKFYEIPETGLSTLNGEIAEGHKKKIGCDFHEQIIETSTLADICEQFVDGPIHFLKIDVEGSEQEVLEGMDLNKFRPFIILIEATLPLTKIPTHESWESILLSNRYQFVYFDGINRFYVAEEQNKLIKYYSLPPDNFKSIEDVNLSKQIRQLDSVIKSLESHIKSLEETSNRLYNSRSWKMTAPLRNLKKFLNSSFKSSTIKL